MTTTTTGAPPLPRTFLILGVSGTAKGVSMGTAIGMTPRDAFEQSLRSAGYESAEDAARSMGTTVAELIGMFEIRPCGRPLEQIYRPLDVERFVTRTLAENPALPALVKSWVEGGATDTRVTELLWKELRRPPWLQITERWQGLLIISIAAEALGEKSARWQARMPPR